MTYIYDILLNFNDFFYEFYEWEKSDKIFHIKKIPIFKVETKVIEDFMTKEVMLDNSFLNIILNKTDIYDKKRVKTLKYACLLTDSYKVIGINVFNNNLKISDLLLDEGYDVISISNRINKIDIEYNIIDSKEINYFETRFEIQLKNNLINELTRIYKEQDIDKLKYLYFEYFNKYELNLEKIYDNLIKSLEHINYKHQKLLELIKLCNRSTSTSNLTN